MSNNFYFLLEMDRERSDPKGATLYISLLGWSVEHSNIEHSNIEHSTLYSELANLLYTNRR